MSLIKSKRDISVDIIKFFAVFLIIKFSCRYSLSEIWPFGHGGGAIGDCLFLFCSGFTLFLKKPLRFDKYYKRRVNRIYPSVWACLVVMLLFGDVTFGTLSLTNFIGRDFIVAIMIYYILIWLIHRYCIEKITWIAVFTAVLTFVAYWFFPYKYEVSSRGIYGILTPFRWIPYFAVMLMGAYVGMERQAIKFSKVRDVCLLLLCLAVFYGVQFAAKKIPTIAPWQIITVPSSWA